MYNGKYISYKRVIERVYSDFKFNYDLDHSDALEWIGDLMSILNIPDVLKQKIDVITITNGRGQLPCDLHSIVQTAKRVDNDTILGNVPSTFFMENAVIDAGETFSTTGGTQYAVVNGLTNQTSLVPMLYASDTFHTRYHCCDVDFMSVSEYTYTVNDNFIFTNFETGCCEMSYLAIPVDDDGFPQIPDHGSWIKACTYEVAYRIAMILLLQDNLSDRKFQLIERDRDWYVAQAANDMRILSIDQEQSFQNNHTRSIKNINHHGGFYANFQTPERRFNYYR